MALSQDLLVNVGSKQVAFPAAYIKVTELAGSKDGITFVAGWHESQGGAQLKSMTYGFVPSLDGPNFIAQAYLHLKSLPEFASATDC